MRMSRAAMAVQALEMRAEMTYAIIFNSAFAILAALCRVPFLGTYETKINPAANAMAFVAPGALDVILRASSALVQAGGRHC